MMSQNSSISSSSGGRYLRWLLGSVAAGVGGLCLLSWVGHAFDVIDNASHHNYRFQLTKLENTAPVDTLFVGDSSLGTLLDIAEWNRVRGLPGQHLALTGSQGYAGSLNMLRRRLAVGKPRNVVVFQTLDMMTRPTSHLGYLQTLPDGAGTEPVPPWTRISEQFAYYFNRDIFLGTLRGLRNRLAGAEKEYIADGYARIPGQTRAPDEIDPDMPIVFSASDILEAKTRYLRELAMLCRREGINCLYVHGPIYRRICETSGDYIRAASARIAEAGLAVVPGTPVCVPQDELANTIDHVRQDLKPAYTRRYFSLIRSYLK